MRLRVFVFPAYSLAALVSIIGSYMTGWHL